ncbi:MULTISPECIES: ECF RNA polymerase sigma factor SigK [Microbacteriaceae]|jgi:RNA polymerase sigma-70 factor (ECF subfamily)|uniref:RNA polymerase sigma factor SigK n=1 Tax=Leucobacter komagatae TaxID=55969 RepID=A0A0D0H291_9MICO|nr:MULTISPECIES: ECF RNA polymerase sigma factor SigK [Microbacteriaceae]KIP51250.1 RNA polymerase sigma factor SigK [Leucobacter komagatae]KQS16465.1 RNA polymerase subunit sigma [Frigoribacterium sp. Leaf186]
MPLAPAPPWGVERSDDDLLVLVAEGNQQAFALFYDSTAARVLGLVRRILVDPAQSEEVTQEIFLEAWQTAARFDPARGKASSWLLTMAHRRAVDRVRASQSARDRDLAVGAREFDDARDDVAETAETRVEHERVTRAMRTLTDLQQQALELVYFGGLSHSEAAREAGVAIGTMKTRVRDALITLRRVIAEAEAA